MEGEPLFNIFLDSTFKSARKRLDTLGANPPQVLLLEGGTEEQRKEAALYFACRCLCPDADKKGSPCLACPTCAQVAALEHLDCLAYDGRLSNAQAEESSVRTLCKENMTALKSVLRDCPHGGKYRVILLFGLESSLRSASANALLKALEEPSASSVFILPVAQREQLLPTLVSRSHCLTLPWPDAGEIRQKFRPLAKDMADFFKKGKGLGAVIPEGKLSPMQANDYLSLLQSAFLRILSKDIDVQSSDTDPLGFSLSKLPDWALVQACGWLGEARAKILAQVTPGRVLEALFERLYILSMRTR